MSTPLFLGGSKTVTAEEMFAGSPATVTRPIHWTTDSPTKVSLAPSDDTLSCVVTGTLLGIGCSVKAAMTEQETIFSSVSFDVIFPVDEIDLTIS